MTELLTVLIGLTWILALVGVPVALRGLGANMLTAIGVLVYAAISGAWFLFLRPSRSESILYFAEGKIASHLGPLLKKYAGPETRMKVVGSDGFYLGCEKPGWRECVSGLGSEWVFFLQKPTDAARDEVRELVAKGCKVTLYVLDPSKQPDSEDVEVLEALKTNHFLVSSNPKMLWIEENHPEQSTVAYNCAFVPPTIASSDPRHSRLDSMFDKLTTKYGMRLSYPLKPKHGSFDPADFTDEEAEEADVRQRPSMAATIKLPKAGGSLTLSGDINLFTLAGAERDLVFALIDKMKEFEEKQGGDG
jgi:hypothetical protein